LAALIDTVRTLGLEAIAQVDLGLRAHCHQPLLDLGVMATPVLAGAAKRLGLTPAESVGLRQYLHGDGGAVPSPQWRGPTWSRPSMGPRRAVTV
jgi:glucosyl-3-phosphoglycerate synthase